MSDLPPELRDRAARAAFDKFSGTVGFGAAVVDNFFQKEADRWRALVDAVAEVLAEHPAEEQRPLAKTVDGRCGVASECWLAWERDTDTRIELYMKYARKEIELARTTRKDLRVRVERAEAELALARRQIGEWAERLDTHDSHGDGAENADRRLLEVIEEMWGSARSVSPDPTTALSGPAGAAHTEEVDQ